jgi:hypothetical protein
MGRLILSGSFFVHSRSIFLVYSCLFLVVGLVIASDLEFKLKPSLGPGEYPDYLTKFTKAVFNLAISVLFFGNQENLSFPTAYT